MQSKVVEQKKELFPNTFLEKKKKSKFSIWASEERRGSELVCCREIVNMILSLAKTCSGKISRAFRVPCVTFAAAAENRKQLARLKSLPIEVSRASQQHWKCHAVEGERAKEKEAEKRERYIKRRCGCRHQTVANEEQSEKQQQHKKKWKLKRNENPAKVKRKMDVKTISLVAILLSILVAIESSPIDFLSGLADEGDKALLKTFVDFFTADYSDDYSDDDTASQFNGVRTRGDLSARQEMCRLPMKRGLCRALLPRWRWDWNSIMQFRLSIIINFRC